MWWPVLWALLTGLAWAQDSVEPTYPYLSTRGQLQLQYDSGDRKAIFGDDDPEVTRNTINRFRADDRIDIRRARVVTTLHLTEDLELINETNYDTRNNNINVLDMYMRADLGDEVAMRVGMFKVPFGWEGLRSSRTTNTIEFSDMTRGLSGVRDTGVAFGGYSLGADWTIGVFQGQGNVWTDLNAGKDVIARVTRRVLPPLRIGASTHYGTFVSGTLGPIPVRRWDLELQYSEGPWKVEAELAGSHGFNYLSQRDTRAAGYYATVVYRIDDQHDVLLSFDRFDPDLQQVNHRLADNRVNARNRLVVGYNYYFARSPEHRIMLNYEFGNEDEGPKTNISGLRVRYQYAW